MRRSHVNKVPLDDYPRINNQGAISKPLVGYDYVIPTKGPSPLVAAWALNLNPALVNASDREWAGNIVLHHHTIFMLKICIFFTFFDIFQFVFYYFRIFSHFLEPWGG